MSSATSVASSVASSVARSVAGVGGGGAPAVPSLLLDHLSPAAAYSIARKLLTAYLGPLINVRRASDDATSDFGFDVDGNLDVAGIAAFCGASVGFITTVFDQSGNAHHISNAENAKQWRIWTGTVIYTKNGIPAAFSSTGSAYMNVASGFTYTELSSCGLVQFSLANTALFQFGVVNGGGSLRFQTTLRAHANAAQGYASEAFSTATWAQISTTITAAARRLWLNGTEGTPAVDASTLSGSNVGLCVGALSNAAYGAAGYFGDQVFFTREISDADRIAVSNDQKTFYGTP